MLDKAKLNTDNDPAVTLTAAVFFNFPKVVLVRLVDNVVEQ